MEELLYVLFRSDGFDYIVDVKKKTTGSYKIGTDSIYHCKIPWENERNLFRFLAGNAVLVYRDNE